MSLSHKPITHIEGFRILSVINYVPKNSANTVISYFHSSDNVWYVKNQMLMLLVAKLKFFFLSRKCYPGPSLIPRNMYKK